MIKNSQKYSQTFGGELTDETLQRMVKDYQNMEAAGLEREQQFTDQYCINAWLGQLYPELKDPGIYQTMITYTPPEKLTDFYERRAPYLLITVPVLIGLLCTPFTARKWAKKLKKMMALKTEPEPSFLKYIFLSNIDYRIFRSSIRQLSAAPMPSAVVSCSTATPLRSFSISDRFTR